MVRWHLLWCFQCYLFSINWVGLRKEAAEDVDARLWDGARKQIIRSHSWSALKYLEKDCS